MFRFAAVALVLTLSVIGPKGQLDRTARERITQRLARFGDDNLLKRHVNIEMYIFDEAHQGDQALTDLLVERATQGVAIHVLYDAVGSSATPSAVFDKLRTAGVKLCAFNPLDPTANRTGDFTQRDHRKIVVVDTQQAFTAGSTLLRINASSVDEHRNGTYIAALSAVTFAVKSIDLTMAYFSPDSQLEDALRDAARRGVKVRLLLPGLSDFGGIVQAGRAHYSRMLKAGIEIHEERRSLLDAKTLEIDG